MAQELWVEKYRPKKLEEYVFVNNSQRSLMDSWVSNGIIPQLLLYGNAGVGKTTLAKVLVNELGINKSDVLFINASSDTGIENIRDRITTFAGTMPFGDWKIIILDECDYMSVNAQAALRHVMEKYSNSARFILTCNYPQKIIPALHSRCQTLYINNLDQTEFETKVAEILIAEGINLTEEDLSILDSYVKASYPDLRKCINLCQQNILDNKLVAPITTDDSSSNDYMISAIELFKQKKYTEARKLICSNLKLDEVDEIFKIMYKNLNFWADTVEKEDEAIIIIRNGMVKSASCADQEINIAATLAELKILADT